MRGEHGSSPPITAHLAAASPTLTTVPANSWLSVTFLLLHTGNSPCSATCHVSSCHVCRPTDMMCRSVPQRPAYATLMMTSSVLTISGTATSSRLSCPLEASHFSALMVRICLKFSRYVK